MAEASAVALATRLEADEVDRVVAELAAHGLIERRQGGLSGWAPTVLGRKHHDLELAEELEAAGGRAAVESAYREFLELNPELLAACTAWQLRLEEATATTPAVTLRSPTTTPTRATTPRW